MKSKILIIMSAIILNTLYFPTIMFAENEIDGTYEGWYYANQGQTGLTLTLEDGEGVFEFYNMPGKSNAADGSYTVKVKDKGENKYRIDGVEWIEKPSTYSFVYLDGVIDGDKYIGTVQGNKSWEFVLTKNNSKYQEISDKTFNNHRYEIFDEGLTWEEAKKACEEKGGYLATITSQEEQKYIEKLISGGNKNGYWLGGYTDDGIDNFEWITGEDMEYTNWGDEQPDFDYEDKLMIYNVDYFEGNEIGKWNNLENEGVQGNNGISFKSESLGYVCEWDAWTNSAEWATPELQKAAENDLIPDVLIAKDMTQPITRGEFAAVCVKLFETMTGGKSVMSSDCTFEDIYYNENRNYILKAYNIDAVAGMSEKEYAPDALLTREQLATMLTRVYKKTEWHDWTLETDDNYTINYSGVNKFDDDSDISDYAKPSVYFMVKYGVLSGIGNNKFAPKNVTPAHEAEGYANATREQAIAMSLRSFENLND